MMPRMDGAAFLRETRERKLISSETKVAIVSAARNIPRVEGVSYVIEKPVSLDTLLSLAETHCRTTRKEDGVATLTRKSALLVDDDQALTTFYARILNGLGYHAVTAFSAEEALSILKHEKDFHYVLVDCVLQEMTGSEFIARARQESPKIKNFIGFSSFSPSSPQAQEMKAVASIFLEKPSSIDEFTALMEANLP